LVRYIQGEYMKKLWLFPLILLIGCAKPPQVEIDAANAALTKLEKNSDVLLYAPELIKPVQTEVQRMNNFVQEKKYDLAKSSAVSIVTLVNSALNKALEKKAVAKSSAEEIILKLEKFSSELLVLVNKVEKSPKLFETFPNIRKEMDALLVKLNNIKKIFEIEEYLEVYNNGSKLLNEMMDFEGNIGSLVSKIKK